MKYFPKSLVRLFDQPIAVSAYPNTYIRQVTGVESDANGYKVTLSSPLFGTPESSALSLPRSSTARSNDESFVCNCAGQHVEILNVPWLSTKLNA